MIIIGWGFKTSKNYGPVRKIQCNNCNNEANWYLQKMTIWFTLFFIPVIPYRINYFLICPVCRNYLGLQKEEFEQLREIMESSAANKSSDDSSRLNSIVNKAGGVIRTETQLNFIRDMQEFEREKERRNKSTQ